MDKTIYRTAQSLQRLDCGLDDRGSIPGGRNDGIFSLRHRCVQTGSGALPASYPMGSEAFIPGLKRPGCEADHSPSSSAEINNAWSYTSIPQYVFTVWYLIKQRLHGVVLS
jgi:hypothetical protein